MRGGHCGGDKPRGRVRFNRQKREKRYSLLRRRSVLSPHFYCIWRLSSVSLENPGEQSVSRRVKGSILLFASLFAIPLARQCCLDATLLAGLQVVGVTLDFLDDVLLLYLPLKSAQRIFQRFAILNANLSQSFPPPNLPKGLNYLTVTA